MHLFFACCERSTDLPCVLFILQWKCPSLWDIVILSLCDRGVPPQLTTSSWITPSTTRLALFPDCESVIGCNWDTSSTHCLVALISQVIDDASWTCVSFTLSVAGILCESCSMSYIVWVQGHRLKATIVVACTASASEEGFHSRHLLPHRLPPARWRTSRTRPARLWPHLCDTVRSKRTLACMGC